MFREILMILFVTGCTLSSQLLVKNTVLRLATRVPALKGTDWLLAALISPGVIGAVLIQGIGFVVWVVVVSRVKLGVAFAISGSCFYLLVASASSYLYGERLAPLQWAGVFLVSIGVLLLSVFSA